MQNRIFGAAWWAALVGVGAMLMACAGPSLPAPGKSPASTAVRLPAGAHLTASELLRELDSWHLSHQLRVQDTALCAAFDADGTLWRKDLSETLVAKAIAQGQVLPAALVPYNAMLERYGEPAATSAREAIERFGEAYEAGRVQAVGAGRGLSRDQVDLDIWPSYNFVFTGWTVRAVKRHARAALEEGFAGEVFEGMRAILNRLRGGGVHTVVVSSSLEPAVRVAAARLGFKAGDVRGQASRVVRGRLTSEILPPVLYGEGKVEAARELCGGRPLLAFADSAAGSDRLMLASARVPIVVQPHGRHLEYATQQGWTVLELPHTEGERRP